jgi:uncharacterized protein (TIGR02231 family)
MTTTDANAGTPPSPPSPAPSAPTLRVVAPVSAVTLLEDRAQVVRRARVRLEAGPGRLIVADVTPLAADRTLRASTAAGAATGLRIDEVRLRRTWIEPAPDEQRPAEAADELADRQRRLADDLESRQETLSGLQKRRGLVEKAVRLYVDELNRRLPLVREPDDALWHGLEELYDALDGLDREWLDRHATIETISRELAGLLVRQRAGVRPPPRLAAEVEIDLEADAAGEHELEVAYTVPCALWRPLHRATLLAGGEVRFECEAAVWQATGEDWDDVQLTFSTARPTQRSTPPLLADDELALQRRREKKVDVEVREAAIATTGEGFAPGAEPGEAGLPGVADGGEPRLLDASGRARVRSDGTMHRVPVFAFTAPAEVDRICCPELTPLVHLRSLQPNTARHPLLAGPVTLLRRSGYVGRSTVDFVAPGERFAMGWGSEDAVRVRREVRERRERSKLTGKLTIARRVELSISNLDDQPTDFTLKERVPVSEIDKVTVQLDAAETSPQPSSRPDDQGIVTWQVSLPPHGTRTITLAYSVTAAGAVQGL